MDDVPAGIVDDAELVKEATAPDAESTDGVAEGEPEWDEDHPGRKVHPAQKAARDKDERDGGEDELEVDH